MEVRNGLVVFLYSYSKGSNKDKKSELLNTPNYSLKYALANSCNTLINTTASLTLNLTLEKLQSQPVFLCIDGTMVSSSIKFQEYCKDFRPYHNKYSLIFI